MTWLTSVTVTVLVSGCGDRSFSASGNVVFDSQSCGCVYEMKLCVELLNFYLTTHTFLFGSAA